MPPRRGPPTQQGRRRHRPGPGPGWAWETWPWGWLRAPPAQLRMWTPPPRGGTSSWPSALCSGKTAGEPACLRREEDGRATGTRARRQSTRVGGSYEACRRRWLMTTEAQEPRQRSPPGSRAHQVCCRPAEWARARQQHCGCGALPSGGGNHLGWRSRVLRWPAREGARWW